MASTKSSLRLMTKIESLVNEYGLPEVLNELANVTFKQAEQAKQERKMNRFFQVDAVVANLEDAYFASQKV